ncbi:MAG: hypothetical protein Q4D85_13605 [Corynebacterium sp.]|uniref:hypothetical protein n=1 Tax=Corynebacterium sp. TaxID=1720 RepID=UPI0026DDC042|nr:hypothetical protein [Corynebacterium sp.]MDO5099771.1 hypothetical protein [Corynebacterium sp.]
MDGQILQLAIMLLGLSPVLFYSYILDKYREKELKNNPYGGWYFIFELTTLLLWGVIFSIAINISLFPSFWLEPNKIPLAITVTFIVVIMVFLSSWIRLGGYKLPLRLMDFMPFLRENMGQSPTLRTKESYTGKFQPTRLFTACTLSLSAVTVLSVVVLYIWFSR